MSTAKERSKNTISISRKRLPLEQYVEGVLAGNRMVLARAITVIESDLPADGELAAQLPIVFCRIQDARGVSESREYRARAKARSSMRWLCI